MNAVISQSDVVTAYGWGLDVLWNGLMSGKTAIAPTQRFAERGFISDQAAIIPDLSPEPDESRVMAMLRRLLSPIVGNLDPATPLILASTVGEIEFIERAVLENNSALLTEARPQALVQRVRQMLGLRGEAIALSSACASSAAALTRAASMIQHGEAPAVLVVTCDAISEFVYGGFSSLMSLSPRAARPFDAGRDGLTLGEAAAWAFVTTRGEGISILGWGNTTDAVHMTAPDRNAGGLTRAIDKALAMSRKKHNDICLIAAHGTGTVYSDAMEMVAFQRGFQSSVPVFSVKGGVGHTLAAAGLVQILVAGCAISSGHAPPTVGLGNVDAGAAGWARNAPADLGTTRVALSTNSGFGGVNTALVLGAAVDA
jgi:3-oxoacyl-[acyl-carrier-protein] synthase II